jgi:aspartate kinase
MARKLVTDWKEKGLAREGMVEKDWATIAIIGHRLAATPGLSARMFAALANAGINVDCISSSEMTLSCIIKRDQAERGVKAVHDEFFADEERGRKPQVESRKAQGVR